MKTALVDYRNSSQLPILLSEAGKNLRAVSNRLF